MGKLLKQRVFIMMQGYDYDDTNDVEHLKNDPLFENLLDGQLASQPTLSRFENNFGNQGNYDLCQGWVDRYIVTSKSLRRNAKLEVDCDDVLIWQGKLNSICFQ